MKIFRHGSAKIRQQAGSVMVSDIVTDWASWIKLRDDLLKTVTD
jgi:hypothetical protein